MNARPGWSGGACGFMRAVITTDRRNELYNERAQRIEPTSSATPQPRVHPLRQMRQIPAASKQGRHDGPPPMTGFSDSPLAADNEPRNPSLHLSARRRELLEVLSRNEKASVLFEGALHTLGQTGNPVRRRLAASALRELMDELQRDAGFTRKEPSLKERVGRLEEMWILARVSLEAGSDSAKGFAQTLDEFFAEFRADYPKQRKQAADTFLKLDPARRDDAPPTVSEALADRWMKFRGYFGNVLHGSIPADEAEFAAWLERFEEFMLAWLRPRPLKDFALIDEFLDDGPPEAEDRAGEVVELIRRSAAHHEYFFDKLGEPGWLGLLAKRGFFKKPVPPVRGDDWIRFPFWPESRYLVRVAARAPDACYEIALGIHKTENVRVHEDVLRIAAHLPGPKAAKLARKEAAWLRDHDGHLMSLPEAAGELIAHLARGGETDGGVQLARALLAVVPTTDPLTSRWRARGRVNEFLYGRVLELAWPALAEADPRRAFKFLCDRLADVIRFGFTEPSGYDSTYVWRPAVESHNRSPDGSLLDLLVNAVRDRALELAATSAGLELVLAELGKRKASLFSRVRLHVLREHGTAEQVAEAVAGGDLGGDGAVWQEYRELLRQRFGELSREQRAPVSEAIARGPGVTLTPDLEERGVTEADIERQAAYWRLGRYGAIAEYLEGDAHQEYERLRSELGDPQHVAASRGYRTGWSEPESPFTAKELRAMGPAGVAQVLREWRPPGKPGDPTREGLAQVLEAIVIEDATGFAEHAREFERLHLAYVRTLVGGLAEAAKAGAAFDWGPVLALCAWAVAQPDAGDEDESPPAWTRRRIAALVTHGFADSGAQIPLEKREHVWRILAALAQDLDPDPGGEDGDGESGVDPATRSINSVRGEAMHAVIRYALWVERALGAEFAGIGSVLEVRELLERHLDPAIDRSPTIRSVYGQWFVQLVRIDEEWARTIAPRAFPAALERAPEFAAAWTAYVLFNRAFTQVFNVLADTYAIAVTRLGQTGNKEILAGDPREYLGDHLLLYRILGAIAGDEDLFARYWSEATTELRRDVVTHAGWSLEQTAELEPDVADRVTKAWEWILAETATDDPEALTGFGAWLAAPALDGAWLLAQAQAVLALGVHLEPDYVVYGAAARLAEAEPAATVAVLRGMVETDTEGWSIQGSDAELHETLTKALNSEDARAREEAEALVELLGARGMTGYRDLLAL